ncbi:MAG: hypothetical protein PVI71_12550 [Desulfobacterales bacterium]|jgi:hypothetical protein
MTQSLKYTLDNQNGFVLGTAILVSAILVLTGVLAIWTSNTELKTVRNETQLTMEFYNAEAGVIDVLENYNSGPTQWLTNDFLTADPIDANSTVNSSDEQGNVVAAVEVRCIESTATPVSGLSNSANNIPRQAHIGPPPPGSGYSLKYFEVRRYAITATSTNGNSQIQVGAWKVFNKF